MGGAGSVIAQAPGATTVVVVRHAEKAALQGDDQPLSEAGRARAEALARALEDAGVSAIITTQFVRTGETAAPTARVAGVKPEIIPVDWDSVPAHAAAVAAAVRRHAGGVVLVVGHSNTVPAIVAALGGEQPDQICDSEYDRLEVVSISPVEGAKVIAARYGAATPVGDGCRSMRR